MSTFILCPEPGISSFFPILEQPAHSNNAAIRKKMKALHFMHPAPLYCLRYQTQPTTFQRHSLRSEANSCLFSIAQIMLPFTTRNG